MNSWILVIALWCQQLVHQSLAAQRPSFRKMLLPDEARNTRRGITLEDEHSPFIDKSSLVVMKSIRDGLQSAVSECQHQFVWDIWNCPVTATTILSRSTQASASREVGFLQAMSAAGIMMSTTRSCNHPDNSLCGCGTGGKFTYSSEALGWKWGGCSHNVKFGERVAGLYLGTHAAATDLAQALKSHNERAGFKAVRRSMRIWCKCHGATGSCVLRTCWKQLTDIREISNHIRKKYKRSKDIRHLQGFQPHNNNVRYSRLTRISKHDLVYVTDSPNYCESDNSIGYLGTLGRECLKVGTGGNRSELTKHERTSCRRLCKKCGHRTGKRVYTEQYDCNCEFKWCCAIECKTCTKNVTKYYCK